MKIRCALAKTSLIWLFLIYFSTAAQADDRWYVEFSFGQSLLGEDFLFADASNLPPGEAEVDYETGFAGGLSFGRIFAAPGRSQWRLEAEYLYRTDELGFAVWPDGTRYEDGDFASVTISVNAYYDVRLWSSSSYDRALHAYVGAGLGWIQEVDVDLEREGEAIEFETDDNGFQWMLGVDWRFASRWNASFEFRAFEASDVEMESASGIVRSDYTPANLLLSLGYRF